MISLAFRFAFDLMFGLAFVSMTWLRFGSVQASRLLLALQLSSNSTRRLRGCLAGFATRNGKVSECTVILDWEFGNAFQRLLDVLEGIFCDRATLWQLPSLLQDNQPLKFQLRPHSFDTSGESARGRRSVLGVSLEYRFASSIDGKHARRSVVFLSQSAH